MLACSEGVDFSPLIPSPSSKDFLFILEKLGSSFLFEGPYISENPAKPAATESIRNPRRAGIVKMTGIRAPITQSIFYMFCIRANDSQFFASGA